MLWVDCSSSGWCRVRSAEQQEWGEEVRSLLAAQPEGRSESSILEIRVRRLGWEFWDSVPEFVALCRDVLGLHVYSGHTARGRFAHFIALEAPDMVADGFKQPGFVVLLASGVFVNRSNPPGVTTRRSRAKIWRTARGIHAYCDKMGYSGQCVRQTQDFDDPSSVADAG